MYSVLVSFGFFIICDIVNIEINLKNNFQTSLTVAPEKNEMASKSWTESCIINTPFKITEGSCFLMNMTNKEKLKMCEEHILEGKSLSQLRELKKT